MANDCELTALRGKLGWLNYFLLWLTINFIFSVLVEPALTEALSQFTRVVVKNISWLVSPVWPKNTRSFWKQGCCKTLLPRSGSWTVQKTTKFHNEINNLCQTRINMISQNLKFVFKNLLKYKNWYCWLSQFLNSDCLI